MSAFHSLRPRSLAAVLLIAILATAAQAQIPWDQISRALTVSRKTTANAKQATREAQADRPAPLEVPDEAAAGQNPSVVAVSTVRSTGGAGRGLTARSLGGNQDPTSGKVDLGRESDEEEREPVDTGHGRSVAGPTEGDPLDWAGSRGRSSVG